MFNTYIPVAKPPTFGASLREVADLADKIRGPVSPQQDVLPQAQDNHLAQDAEPAAPQTNILVTHWE
jgi:hypothetical protein